MRRCSRYQIVYKTSASHDQSLSYGIGIMRNHYNLDNIGETSAEIASLDLPVSASTSVSRPSSSIRHTAKPSCRPGACTYSPADIATLRVGFNPEIVVPLPGDCGVGLVTFSVALSGAVAKAPPVADTPRPRTFDVGTRSPLTAMAPPASTLTTTAANSAAFASA